METSSRGWSTALLVGIGVACTPAKPPKTAAGDEIEAANRARKSSQSTAGTEPGIDLSGNYVGTIFEAIRALHSDADALSRWWTQNEPRDTSSRQTFVLSVAARGDLYLRLRHKLTASTQIHFFDAKTLALLERAARSQNQDLRQKALNAEHAAERAWTNKCTQEVEALDRVVAGQAGLVWRYSQAEPSLSPQLQAAGSLLATLQNLHGNAWLESILAPYGVTAHTGSFGSAPQPSPLLPCPQLPKYLAPLGPLDAPEAPLPDGLSLPTATRDVTAFGEGPRVYVSKSGIYWGKERAPVAQLGGAIAKAQGSRSAEVLLFGDRATPFRVLREVASTLKHAGYGRILLVTQSSDSSQLHGVVIGFAEKSEDPQIDVVNQGYSVRWQQAPIGGECGAMPESVIAVARIGNKLDAAGLDACLARVLPPEGGSASSIFATPDTPLSDIVATIEAAANHGTASLLIP